MANSPRPNRETDVVKPAVKLVGEDGKVRLCVGQQIPSEKERVPPLQAVPKYWFNAVMTYVQSAAFLVLNDRGTGGRVAGDFFLDGEGERLQSLVIDELTVAIIHDAARRGSLQLPLNIEEAIHAWLEEQEKYSPP